MATAKDSSYLMQRPLVTGTAENTRGAYMYLKSHTDSEDIGDRYQGFVEHQDSNCPGKAHDDH